MLIVATLINLIALVINIATHAYVLIPINMVGLLFCAVGLYFKYRKTNLNKDLKP
jgi:hypothetical protein